MKRPAIDRFLEKVDQQDGPDGCWLWTAQLNHGGYGCFTSESGKAVLAHRWAYEHYVGPIPDGLQIDHLCRVRHCVRPEHMEAVTQTENVRRGVSGEVNGARQLAKTHCPHGHPYSGENLYVNTKGQRVCRTCQRLSRQTHRAVKRAMDDRRRGYSLPPYWQKTTG